jgi:hypothetical protein
LEITKETIDLKTIQSVGVVGCYLEHPKTLDQFRKSGRKWS